MNPTSETAFEEVIEAHFLENGYTPVASEGFDRERAIFPETVLAFVCETQPNVWAKLERLLGDRTGEQVLGDLCKWMDNYGALATLRHGYKCYGRTLHAAYFKSAHELNPELEARYAANRLGLTRQLHFSPRSEKSLDVTLSLNGIPVATLELKNPLTGQTVEDARRQYQRERGPAGPDFRVQATRTGPFRSGHRVGAHDHPAGRQSDAFPALRQGIQQCSRQPTRSSRVGATERLTCGKRCCNVTVCLNILARFIHLQIDARSATIGATGSNAETTILSPLPSAGGGTDVSGRRR